MRSAQLTKKKPWKCCRISLFRTFEIKEKDLGRILLTYMSWIWIYSGDRLLSRICLLIPNHKFIKVPSNMINHQYQSLDLTVKGYAKTDMTKIFTEWFEKNHEDINIPFTLCKNYYTWTGWSNCITQRHQHQGKSWLWKDGKTVTADGKFKTSSVVTFNEAEWLRLMNVGKARCVRRESCIATEN